MKPTPPGAFRREIFIGCHPELDSGSLPHNKLQGPELNRLCLGYESSKMPYLPPAVNCQITPISFWCHSRVSLSGISTLFLVSS